MQWRRVDAFLTDGHCSPPLEPIHSSDVALCINGRALPDNAHDASIVDAVSGVTLSNRRYNHLFVDTSGALLWDGVDDTVVVSSGINSAAHVVANVRCKSSSISFRYGVAFVTNERHVWRFDIDPARTVEPDCKV